MLFYDLSLPEEGSERAKLHMTDAHGSYVVRTYWIDPLQLEEAWMPKGEELARLHEELRKDPFWPFDPEKPLQLQDLIPYRLSELGFSRFHNVELHHDRLQLHIDISDVERFEDLLWQIHAF